MSGESAREKIIAFLGEGYERSASAIMDRAGLSAGAIYPVLAALEREGVVESRFLEGRYPRKRVYRLVRR